ncbi:MAG: CAP domain-containing protein [Planctomycetes bacterium]|nr:CAP domain-containing protein [Planctomycetota bacterium]
MFTLQILDDGRSFQHALGDGATTIGGGPGADLVLRAAGAAAAHARCTVVDGVVRLEALAPLKVNGKAVDRADLDVGDRIELGGSYIVLGRAVAAAPAAAPVAPVAATTSMPVAAPRARRDAAPASGGSSRLVLAAAGLAVVGLAAFALLGGDAQQTLRDQVAIARRLRETAKLEEATTKLDQLAQQWADATDGRLDLLQPERDAIAAAHAAADELRRQVVDPADPRTYQQWLEALQSLEQNGRPDQRIGARIVRGNLRATFAQKPKPAGAPADAQAPTVADGKAAAIPAPDHYLHQSSPAKAGAAPAASAPAAAIESTRKTDASEATKLANNGLFAPAIALLQASLGEQEDAAALRAVEARLAEVRAQAKVAMDKALAEAADEARGDAREAAKSLHAVRHRYPPGGEFAALDERIRAYEAAAATPAGAVAASAAMAKPAVGAADAGATTLAALRGVLDKVRGAEEAGDFAVAADQLRAAADAVRDRDAAFAGRLLARAEESALFAAWHAAIGDALAGGAKLETTLASGTKAALQGTDGARLVLAADGRRVSWHDIAPEGVAALAEQSKARGDAALGAAALLYKKAANGAAEALLQKALKAEPALKDGADRVLARGRGEPLQPGGYTLAKDGFTSARSLEIQKQATALRAQLDAALRDRAGKARAELWSQTMAAGPEAVQALAAAMKKELATQVGRFDRPSWRKDHDTLVAARQALDGARQHARELIYDEVKYFYPYKPPAVSSDRYAEYVRVQAEVDRRVAALRTLWNDPKLKLAVPGSVQADLERIDWLAARLAELGDADDAALARLAWVRSLPAGKLIGARELCLTPAEFAEFETWRRIERYNDITGRTLMSAQREQLRITNEYRAMFRHRPLAIVPKVCTAAQGHAEEMSKLGYFAHQSPTPGRTTPYDRMRLAGYGKGASENIALVDGAQGAHDAWCQSSGHHRNLLHPDHHEVGIGNDGRYWVQNFGRGTVYQESVAWDQAEKAK